MVLLYKRYWLLIVAALGFTQPISAQFSLTGQVRTRTEFRDGLGTLNPIGTKPAFFTSQRTGLSFGYKADRLSFGVTLRDVRVWGQDASSISNADGNRFFVHEAWGELTLANKADTSIKFKAFDNLSVRLGRQEFVYDDVRLLGNLDWLQQARRFDAILFKSLKKGWQLDLGLAFNQNTDGFGVRGTNYVPGAAPAYIANSRGNLVAVPSGFLPTNGKGGAPVLAGAVGTNGQNQQFKSLQFLYLSRKFGQTKLSVLALKDDFSKYRTDSLGNAANGVVYGRRYDVDGTNSRYTYGAMLTGVQPLSKKTKLVWQAFGYLQSGNDPTGTKIKAHHAGLNAQLQQGKWLIGPGYEVLSGDNTVSPNNVNNRFDPLYGTPHRHWGYMDYFYVGTGSPVGGLANTYLKARYTASPALFITFDVHNFALANQMVNTFDANRSQLNSQLGQEVDVVLNYTMNKFTNLELGYGYFAATNSLEFVKLGTADNARHNAHWLYLMVNLRPDFLSSVKK
jgi:Alginate export